LGDDGGMMPQGCQENVKPEKTRNPKQYQMTKKRKIPNQLVFGFHFSFLDLMLRFVSDFEFRISIR
jgi:hypothetical protein